MAAACEAIRAAVAAGKRICVHGDYDVDGICATALAVLILRELGADVESHLPSRFEEGYGVARQTLSNGSPRRAAGSCSRSTAASRPSRRSPRPARPGSRSSSPTTTVRARRCPTARSSRRGRPAYPFPELCGTGVVYKLGQALLGADSERARPPPRPGRAGDDRRRRPARGREPCARDRRAASARADAEAGPARADGDRARRSGRDRRGRGRLSPRAADQRRRPALPPGRGARAAAHRRRRRGPPARRAARGAQPRASGASSSASCARRSRRSRRGPRRAAGAAATSSRTRAGTRA